MRYEGQLFESCPCIKSIYKRKEYMFELRVRCISLSIQQGFLLLGLSILVPHV